VAHLGSRRRGGRARVVREISSSLKLEDNLMSPEERWPHERERKAEISAYMLVRRRGKKISRIGTWASVTLLTGLRPHIETLLKRSKCWRPLLEDRDRGS